MIRSTSLENALSATKHVAPIGLDPFAVEPEFFRAQLNAPSISVAFPSADQIRLDWQDAPSATHYRLWSQTENNVSFSLVSEGVAPGKGSFFVRDAVFRQVPNRFRLESYLDGQRLGETTISVGSALADLVGRNPGDIGPAISTLSFDVFLSLSKRQLSVGNKDHISAQLDKVVEMHTFEQQSNGHWLTQGSLNVTSTLPPKPSMAPLLISTPILLSA